MCRESIELIRWGAILLCLALAALGCLEEMESPRPLPPVQPDAFEFDPREPIRMPGMGSGYGSGVVAPTGRGPVAPTGEAIDMALMMDVDDADPIDQSVDEGVDEGADEEED